MLPILLALTASFGYGAGDFLAGRVTQRLTPALVVFYIQAVQSVAVVLLALMTQQPFVLSAFSWGASAGLINAIGLMLYYQALKIGKNGLVAPIAASGAVLPVVVTIVRGTIPSLVTFFGLLTVLIGIAVSTFAFGTQREEPESPSPPCRGATQPLRSVLRIRLLPKVYTLLAIAAAISFGIFFILVNQGSSVPGAGILWVTLGVQIGALPTTIVILMLQGNTNLRIAETTMLLILGVITVLNLVADTSLTYALSLGNLGIVSILASLAPVITGLFARIINSEHLSQVQTLGASLVVLGTLVVAYGR